MQKKISICNNTLLYPVIIVVTGVIAYINSLNVPFIFDDTPFIVNNAAITKLSNFLEPSSLPDKITLLPTLKLNIITRFFSFVSFAVNYQISGLNVEGFHVINILIHILNALLIYQLSNLTFKTCYCEKLKEDGNSSYLIIDRNRRAISMLLALMFLSHPIQTEAVTYIVQRFTSLCTLFYLGAFVAYVKYRLSTNQKPGWLIISYVAACIAMLTKEIAVTLFLNILLYEYTFFSKPSKATLVRIVPFFLSSFLVVFAIFFVKNLQHSHLGLERSMEILAGDDVISRFDYFCTQLTVILKYILLLIYPVNQNLDYDYPIYHTLLNGNVLSSLLVIVVLLGYSIFCLHISNKENKNFGLRFVGFGILWFFFAISVESSFIPIKDVIMEHRLYLPSFGFFLAAFFFAFHIMNMITSNKENVYYALMFFSLLIVVVLTFATFKRNKVWANTIIFWEDVVRKSPVKKRPHIQLSIAYAQAGRDNDSMEQARIAAKLSPIDKNPHFFMQSNIEDQLKNVSADGHNKRGLDLLNQGNISEAEHEFKLAIDIKPAFAEAHSNLAVVHQQTEHFSDALIEYNKALQIDPKNPYIHYNLGIVLQKVGRISEAYAHFHVANDLAPHNPAFAQHP